MPKLFSLIPNSNLDIRMIHDVHMYIYFTYFITGCTTDLHVYVIILAISRVVIIYTIYLTSIHSYILHKTVFNPFFRINIFVF